MDGNLMNLLLALIALILGSGGLYIIKFLNNKIGQDNVKHYYQIAKTIVMSIEQLNPSLSGVDKKDLAIKELAKLTNNKISEEDASRLIEAAVYEVKKLLDNNISK